MHWTYESIIQFAREQEAIVTIHAGRKEDGIDKAVTNATPLEEAIKEYIADHVHFLRLERRKISKIIMNMFLKTLKKNQ